MQTTNQPSKATSIMEAAASVKNNPNKVKEVASVTANREPQYDNLILGDGPGGVYSTDPGKSPVNNNVPISSAIPSISVVRGGWSF